MKKIILITAITAITLVSCKRDYTCECKVTTLGITTTGSTTIHDTKKNATKKCDEGDASTTVFGITSTAECSIK